MKLYRYFVIIFNAFTILLFAAVAWVYFVDDDSISFYITDTKLGEKYFEERDCFTCHGTGGKEPQVAEYPHLNLQPRSYLLTQMRDIKSGHRSNGMTSIMQVVIDPVRKDEMREIARYLNRSK